ncbi:hypothetical protein AYO38_09460 [bacterium SCGC AG-212-C10]|nr:hypothetical protein AYO38_09460 [bacterium SCGC AG-212-C10]
MTPVASRATYSAFPSNDFPTGRDGPFVDVRDSVVDGEDELVSLGFGQVVLGIGREAWGWTGPGSQTRAPLGNESARAVCRLIVSSVVGSSPIVEHFTGQRIAAAVIGSNGGERWLLAGEAIRTTAKDMTGWLATDDTVNRMAHLSFGDDRVSAPALKSMVVALAAENYIMVSTGTTQARSDDYKRLLPPEIVSKVARYTAGTLGDPENPLPADTAEAALRIAARVRAMTGSMPTLSADDEGSCVVSVRLDSDRMLYVEVDDGSLDAVVYSAADGTRNLNVTNERDLNAKLIGELV